MLILTGNKAFFPSHSSLCIKEKIMPSLTLWKWQTKTFHLYDATCVSSVVFDCSSWLAPKAAMNKLDTCYRKHLRTISWHRWPTADSIRLCSRCATPFQYQ